MDKLQKIGAWIWWNKERMVLLAIIMVLAYRVYVVAFPPEPEPMLPPAPPRGELPPRAEAPPGLLPPQVPPPPPMDVPEDYAALAQRNPFSYRSAPTGPGTTAAGEEEADIQLLRIQVAGGSPRGQFRTGGRNYWRTVGQQAGEYRVDDIDAEEGTAVVFAEQLQRPIQLAVRGS